MNSSDIIEVLRVKEGYTDVEQGYGERANIREMMITPFWGNDNEWAAV